MKKVTVFSILVLAFLALAVAPVAFSGDGCPFSKKAAEKSDDTKVQSASSATCPGHAANAQMTAGKGCTPEQMAACAKAKGITPEECAKMCAGKGNCQMATINIKGMTCTSCETTITAALGAVPGFMKVVTISYKDGVALVCYDPEKCKTEAMTTAIADKGYQAEIVPAVATTSEVPNLAPQIAGCAKPCPAAGKACCAKAKASDEKKGDGSL